MYLHPPRLVSGMSACWSGILAICYHLAHFPNFSETLSASYLAESAPSHQAEWKYRRPTGRQYASLTRWSTLRWNEVEREQKYLFSRKQLFWRQLWQKQVGFQLQIWNVINSCSCFVCRLGFGLNSAHFWHISVNRVWLAFLDDSFQLVCLLCACRWGMLVTMEGEKCR